MRTDRVKLLLMALVVALAASACDSDEPAQNVPLYLGGPNGDDAALRGQLIFDERGCLIVLDDSGASTLVALPAVASSWDGDAHVVTVGGRRLPIGEKVVLGGSGVSLARALSEVKWSTRPSTPCSKDQVIWFAGDSAQLVSEVPALAGWNDATFVSREGRLLTVEVASQHTVVQIDLSRTSVFDGRSDCLQGVQDQLAQVSAADRICLYSEAGRGVLKV